MSESLIGFSHFVSVFATLYSCAKTIAGID
jgi:hypothetical protein